MGEYICKQFDNTLNDVKVQIRELNQDITAIGQSGGNIRPQVDAQEDIVRGTNAGLALRGCGFILEVDRGVLSGTCSEDACPSYTL